MKSNNDKNYDNISLGNNNNADNANNADNQKFQMCM